MEKTINVALNATNKVKKIMALILMVLVMVIVCASVVELAIILFKELIDPTKGSMFLDISELLNLFSFVFMVLIGLELLETLEMYFQKNIIHAEIVLLIAVIAITRKVILLDLDDYDPIAIIGLALIIIALGVSYFLIKRSYGNSDDA